MFPYIQLFCYRQTANIQQSFNFQLWFSHCPVEVNPLFDRPVTLVICFFRHILMRTVKRVSGWSDLSADLSTRPAILDSGICDNAISSFCAYAITWLKKIFYIPKLFLNFTKPNVSDLHFSAFQFNASNKSVNSGLFSVRNSSKKTHLKLRFTWFKATVSQHLKSKLSRCLLRCTVAFDSVFFTSVNTQFRKNQ